MRNSKHSTGLSRDLKVGHLIGLLERAQFKQITKVLSPLNVTFQQFIALAVLAGRGAISNADLARISQMTPQSANQVVKSLESEGWIAREQHPEHQRIVLLSITASGKAILQKADATVMTVEKRMLGGLSSSEKKQFQQQLKNCLAALGETEQI